MAQLPETLNTEFQNWKGILLTPKSLYIWSNNNIVTDSQFFDLFNQVAQVVSARISRDSATGESLGYVHFNNNEDAMKALDELNDTSIGDIDRRENAAKVFVKNIDMGIGKTQLYDIFSTFGNIISCHFERDLSHRSKGYGYVNFENEESAQNAIDNLNGKLIKDKELYVCHFLLKEDRESLFSGNDSKLSNLYVTNLSELLTEDDLRIVFGEYGTITSAVVMRNKDGSSRCYGFVNFKNPDCAAKALDGLNGMKFDGKKWCVKKAINKSKRDLEMMKNLDQIMKKGADRHQNVELYIRNLNYSIMDEKLRELFSEFGRVISYKVLKDPNGISKGHGFVEFSTPEEANRALRRMNGKMVAGRLLYVSFSHRKMERRVMLQEQLLQMRPVTTAPPVTPHMPLYPPGAPAPGPQFLDGKPPPDIIPQVLHRGDDDCYPPVHNTRDDPRPAVTGGMLPVPNDMGDRPAVTGGMLPVPNDMGDLPIWDALEETTGTQTWATRTLVTALANAPPEHHMPMLGQVLYRLVHNLEPDSAERVTGMILRMGQTEVLHLIESPDALKEKVAETTNLLHVIMAAEEELASLMNDNPLF